MIEQYTFLLAASNTTETLNFLQGSTVTREIPYLFSPVSPLRSAYDLIVTDGDVPYIFSGAT